MGIIPAIFHQFFSKEKTAVQSEQSINTKLNRQPNKYPAYQAAKFPTKPTFEQVAPSTWLPQLGDVVGNGGMVACVKDLKSAKGNGT